MHCSSLVGRMCLYVSAVKTHEVQTETKKKTCVALICGLLREQAEEYFLCDYRPSEQYSRFFMCECVENIMFSVTMRHREQWKSFCRSRL